MAGSLGNSGEVYLLDHMFGGDAYTPTLTGYIGLFVSAPADDSTGYECSGAAYARASADNTGTTWAAAATGAKWNISGLLYPSATGDWGTVTAIGIFDDATAGNMLAWGHLAASKTIASGEAMYFASGTLVITFD